MRGLMARMACAPALWVAASGCSQQRIDLLTEAETLEAGASDGGQGAPASVPEAPAPDGGSARADAGRPEAGRAQDIFACVSNRDCFPFGVCDDRTSRCVECLSGADCLAPWAQRCDVTRNRCVQCLEPSHCFGAEECVFGECVECLTDADCGEAQPYCDRRDDRCVECMTDGHCAAGRECNPFERACVAADGSEPDAHPDAG